MAIRDSLHRYLLIGSVLVLLASLAIAQATLAHGSVLSPGPAVALEDERPSAQTQPATPSEEEVDAILQDPGTAGAALAAAAAQDPEAAGLAIAAAAAKDAQATGNTLTSAVKQDASAVADALKAAARSDVGATGDALNMGPAKDSEALAALGEVLPVQVWLRPVIPVPGPDTAVQGGWVQSDGRAPVDTILGKYANPPDHLRIAVLKIPLAVLSTKATPTPGTRSAFSARPFEMPAFPSDHTANTLFRLTVGSGADSGFVAAHVTFSVDKSWMDENNIHPWSVMLNRHDVEAGVWEFARAQRVGEDDEQVQFRMLVPGFSTWAVTGKQTAPGVEFRVDDLSIGDSLGAGEPVDIEVQVTNLTSERLAPVLGVFVDSVAESAQRVILEPNVKQPVTFSVRFNQGSFQVRVDRLTGSLSVGPAPPPTATPLPGSAAAEGAGEGDGGDGGDGGGNTVVVAGLAVAVIIVAVVVAGFFVRRRRS